MGVVCVQPVAIRCAIFWVLYSFCVCCFLYLVAMMVGVCAYGPDVLFLHQGNVFFGLMECCDIEAGFCISVYVTYVLGL